MVETRTISGFGLVQPVDGMTGTAHPKSSYSRPRVSPAAKRNRATSSKRRRDKHSFLAANFATSVHFYATLTWVSFA